MNLVRRCRPSLAATTVLTALILGGCSYSPERSLTVADTAKPAGGQQAAADPKTKADSGRKSSARTKSSTTKSETVKVAGTSRRVAAVDAAQQAASSAQTPRRQLVASNSERECLVRAMYFESQRSSREGLLAVGTVVMNRVNSPSYPGTICGVVGQKRQFAAGVLSRPMSPRDRQHAEAVADELLAGKRHTGIGDAMFFHVATRRYKYPNMRYLHVAGGNIFYRKVGRNAPRVVEGPVLAYADTAPDSAKPAAPETPVTVASAATDKPAAVRAAPPAERHAALATPAAASVVPLPLPRTALALPQQDAKAAETNAGIAPAQVQASTQTSSPAPTQTSAVEQLAAKPAAGNVSYTLPLGTALSSSSAFNAEPSTLLSYRAISVPAQAK
ncbi:cell wall hydrolase [Pseudochelatococcus sp. B33]